jgi:hypothetical protein
MTLPAAVPSAADYLKVTSYSGGAGVLEWATAGGIASVLADTTPQLGGNLDIQTHKLVGNGGTTGMAISANGEVTNTAQPMVLAYNSASDGSATGNATAATVDFDTEIKDQGGDFATDTFTAPVVGGYQVCVAIRLEGITLNTSDDFTALLVTSNRTYRFNHVHTNAIAQTPFYVFSIIVDMDADDTLSVTVAVTGQGADNVTIGGSSEMRTFMSVYLVG